MNKEEIMELTLSSGSDDLGMFGGRYRGNKFIQQVPDEIVGCLDYLYQNLHKVTNYMEVGAAGGGVAYLVNVVLSPDKTIIVDNNQHSAHVHRKNSLNGFNVTEFIGNSQGKEAHDFVSSLQCKIDLLFIDADHSYSGVKTDTANFIEFVNSGGYIMFHDGIICHGVNTWVEELKKDPQVKHITRFGTRLGIDLFQKI